MGKGVPAAPGKARHSALGDAVKSHNFINLFSNLLLVDVSVDNTSQWHILQHNIHSALCEASPAAN